MMAGVVLVAGAVAACSGAESKAQTVTVNDKRFLLFGGPRIDQDVLGEVLVEGRPEPRSRPEIRAVRGFSPEEVVAVHIRRGTYEWAPFYLPAFALGFAGTPDGDEDYERLIECCSDTGDAGT